MPSKNITFDPDSGSLWSKPDYSGGSDFNANLNVYTTANAAFDLTGYTGSAAMSKSVAVGATLELQHLYCWFHQCLDGKMKLSLGSTSTRSLNEGRYVYDVIVAAGGTFILSLMATYTFTTQYHQHPKYT